MIPTLYKPFRHWSDGGSVYILSDLHLDDKNCMLMDPNWVTPEQQISIINKVAMKNDTFICLGDVGNPEHIKKIKAKRKILILGNHDTRGRYTDYFDEIYSGPLFIAEKILLSHEPVYGLPWCLNIHGHDHNDVEAYKKGCRHLNLAANMCGYTPVNLGKLIKDGILSDIPTIHRVTIDTATERKKNAPRPLIEGDRVRVIGDSKTLWIRDYNVRVSTEATVFVTPKSNDKKILLVLDEIDGDKNVCTYVRKSAIFRI